MTLEEKREEVAWRRARCREHDGETCTSVLQELFSLIYNGCVSVADWTEEAVDAYLAEYDEEGQPITEDTPSES